MFTDGSTTRTLTSLRQIVSGLFAACLLLVSVHSHAAAPLAGELILNVAEVNYEINNNPQATQTAENALTVDNLLNVHVASIAPSAVASFAGQQNAAIGFNVTNLSNSVNDILLTIKPASTDNAGAPNTYTGTPPDAAAPSGQTGATTLDYQLFVDSNNNGIYEPGIDSAQLIDDLNPGESVVVFIVSDIPANVTENQLAAVALIAQLADKDGNVITNDDSGNTSPAGAFENGVSAAAGTASETDKASARNETLTLFADGASALSSDGAADTVNNGQHSDTNGYLFKLSPALLEKSANIIDCKTNEVLEISSTGEVYKGACVRYTLTVKVIQDAVDAIRVNDAIPDGTAYVSNSLSLDGSAMSDANDADEGKFDNNQVSFDLGTLNKDTTKKIEFTVEVL